MSTVLAVGAMDPTLRFVFLLVAVVLFAVAAFFVTVTERVNLVALGLAFFAIPFMWDALAAS